MDLERRAVERHRIFERMRNPAREAFDRLEGRYEVRVLEPSPPAVDEEPWFADDPAARGEVPEGRQVVSPVSSGDLLWDDLAREDSELAEWCAARWLGAYRRLEPAPPALVDTRLALHRAAESVLTPARQAANGKIALRYVAGGFGTPYYGEDIQLRVEGTELITESPSGTERDVLEGVDDAASRFLGDFYGFCASVLEELRAQAGPELEPSRVQLWTEHFDLAVELGAESAGVRAAYGGSPGDETHPEPYLYVAPWDPDEATVELAYADLVTASDQRAAALEFFRDRLAAATSAR
jgi:hypothetical protein